ncbi:DMT family transporter, partial [Desulforamulus ruminis]
MNPYQIGVVLVLLSAVFFGIMPIFALYAYEGGASVNTLLLMRFSIATVLFFLYILIKREAFAIKAKHFLFLFILGGIFYTLQSLFYFSSVQYIPASLAVLIFYTYPIYVVLLSYWVDKEKLNRQIIFSILLSIIGLSMVVGTSFNAINHLGVLLAVGAALVYSGYTVLGSRVVKQLPAVITSAFVSLFATVSLLIMGLARHELELDLELQAWVAIAVIAVLSTVVSMFTYFRGLELVGSTKTAILSMVEPLITIGLSVILFHDKLTVSQLIGG